MSVHASLLDNIECEYKFAVNQAYAATFIHDFCSAYNDWLHEHYGKLPDAFKQTHDLTRYLADESKVEVETLTNSYFDTADDLIFARFKAGLRLRGSSLFEGVEQTIKYKSEDGGIGAAHTHVEHNLRVDQKLNTPDLTLFAPGVLPPELVALTQEHELISKYQTNFTRTKLLLEVPAFVTFEVALDQGEIIAGTCRSPICEVECELKAINHDFLDAHLGSRIYDLEDVRFEFSALISDLLLKVSGAPTVFKDTSLLMQQGGAQRITANGITFATIDPLGAEHQPISGVATSIESENLGAIGALEQGIVPIVTGLTDVGSYVAMAPAPHKPAKQEGYFGHMEPLTAFDSDNDGLGEGLSSEDILKTKLDAYDDDHALSAKIAELIKQEEALRAAYPAKSGGVIGLEPFSKLKRAVVLATFYRMNQKWQPDSPQEAQLSVADGTRHRDLPAKQTHGQPAANHAGRHAHPQPQPSPAAHHRAFRSENRPMARSGVRR